MGQDAGAVKRDMQVLKNTAGSNAAADSAQEQPCLFYSTMSIPPDARAASPRKPSGILQIHHGSAVTKAVSAPAEKAAPTPTLVMKTDGPATTKALFAEEAAPVEAVFETPVEKVVQAPVEAVVEAPVEVEVLCG